MGEGIPIAALVDQQTLRKLTAIEFEHAISSIIPNKDKTSSKDRQYIQALEESPELRDEISQTLQKLSKKGVPMPIIHITSRAIRYDDGSEIPTGYIENIQENGFRPRDTNVAAFIERKNSVRIGHPDYFAANPHKLLRDMAEIIGNYKHHGIRTNKTSLEGMKNQGVGIPTMLIINTQGVRLLKGTDYDDHFRLHNHVPARNIMGAVDLDGKTSSDIADVKEITKEFLGKIESFLLQEVPTGIQT